MASYRYAPWPRIGFLVPDLSVALRIAGAQATPAALIRKLRRVIGMIGKYTAARNRRVLEIMVSEIPSAVEGPLSGERGRTRTCDPCLKRALLYQLSYAPTISQYYCIYLQAAVSAKPAFLINQFQRKLNLPRTPCRLADKPKPVRRADASRWCSPGRTRRDAKNICRQSHIDNVEDVEKLRAELQAHAFHSALPMAESRVFYASE